MVLKISLSKFDAYISVILIIVFLFFDFGIYTVPSLLFYLLFVKVSVIPALHAWFSNSPYDKLIKLNICYIAFAIVVYSIMYQKYGLVINGELIKDVDFLTALYFSGTTWTTVGYGDISAPTSIRLLTTVEALNSYFAMAILMALIILWLDEQTALANNYISSLRHIPNKKNTSIKKDIKYFREYYSLLKKNRKKQKK
jgi:hypothetical protein